jgi:hypothetical protein
MNQRDHRMVGALVNFSGAMDASATIADGALVNPSLSCRSPYSGMTGQIRRP